MSSPVPRRHSLCLLGQAIVVLFALAHPGHAGETSSKRDTSSEMLRRPANIVLQDIMGAEERPLANHGQKATLLFFLMHDCPVANGYAPEINRIVAEYSARKIRCAVVYVEADLPVGKARRHAADYGFKCSALWDPEHRLVAAVGATISPEAALVSPAGEVLYRGRIDDRVVGLGKRRVEPTHRDLRLALDAFINNRTIASRLTKAIGCYIPDRLPTESTRKPKLP